MRKWKLPQSVFLVATFKAAKLVNPLLFFLLDFGRTVVLVRGLLQLSDSANYQQKVPILKVVVPLPPLPRQLHTLRVHARVELELHVPLPVPSSPPHTSRRSPSSARHFIDVPHPLFESSFFANGPSFSLPLSLSLSFPICTHTLTVAESVY